MVLSSSALTVAAQQQKTYSVRFTDTLAASQSTLLYNIIKIKNLSADSLSLKINFQGPAGWSLVSQGEMLVTIPPYNDVSLPVSLKKRNSISLIWQQVGISVLPAKSKIPDHYSFNIYTEPVSRYTVTSIYNGLSKTNPKDIQLQFILKNTGNVDGLYHLAFQNEKLELDHTMLISLKPGKDSTVLYTHHINKKYWQQFTNETIRITVADSLFKKNTVRNVQRFTRSTGMDNGTSQYYESFDIYRSDSVFSMHSSDYSNIRVGLETGVIGSSRQISYYGAVGLDYDISKYSRFYFNYRSRQFGLYNTIDRDVFTIGLKSRHWDLEAGKISNSKFFLTYGNGVSIAYKWKKNSSVTLFGVKHTPGFHTTNDNAGLTFKYNIKNVVIGHDLLYNTDSASHIQSGIINTDIQWRTRNIDFMINGGFGSEKNSLQNPIFPDLSGGFGGYRINYKIKSWSLTSQYRAFGKNFPGVNAGARSQSHGISYRAKKTFTEIFYQVNITNNNFLKDTLYNTDILTFNTTKYGMRFTVNPKRSYITLGFGWLIQKGQQAYSFTPRYQFMELLYSIKGKKYFGLSLSSSNGYSAQKKYNTGPVFFTLNSLNLNFKNVGISGGYTSMPLVDTVQKSKYRSTVYGGPYVTAHLGKYFSVGTQYSLSKTLFDSGVNSFAGLNATYNNEKAKTFLQVNVSAPLKKAEEKNANPFKYGYVNISLRKTFNVPFIFKKKFHTLKTVFVEDENSNGRADEQERRLSNVEFTMNRLHFVSDKQGVAMYKHIGKDDYSIDFTGSELRGLIPRNGAEQVIRSEKDNSKVILFSKSRMLTGHIDILQDSAADDKFLLNYIKVMATDSAGKTYSTTTDADGNYFINLPGGHYSVTLNPEAFNQNYRPDKMSAEADLTTSDNISVNFIIKQKRREIKMLDTNGGKVINLKQSDIPKEDPTKPKNSVPKH